VTTVATPVAERPSVWARARVATGQAWREQRLAFVGAVLSVAIVALAVFGPFFAPYGPNAPSADLLAPPSGAHLMGTDQFGRDVFSRWLYGGRTSLFVAITAIGGALIIGGFAGLIAGYRNGSGLDSVIMRVNESILAFPVIVLIIGIAGTIGPTGISIGPVHFSSTWVLIFLLGIAFLPPFVRLARAAALAEMQETYVSAARALGSPGRRIVLRDLLPNILASLVIQASFSLALAIGAEATISYLGFGIQPPQSSWGNLVTGGQQYILEGDWWLVAFPSAIIVVAVFAFNLLGDGLRDLLDPKQRSKVGPAT
jgi:peptide/nickel transport system permease protein